MKITFLGTSHGVPEKNRRCSCTMIETNGAIYFIDMGFNAIEELVNRSLEPDSVRAIFITHMHGDHTNGLVPFVDLCTWYYRSTNVKIYLPESGAGEAMSHWLTLNRTSNAPRAEFITFSAGNIYEDENIKVTSFATKHCPFSHSHLIECEGRRILFTGDLKNPKIDFPTEIFTSPVNLIVNEAAHFHACDYIDVYREKDIGRIIFNHYVQWNYDDIDKVIPEALAPIPVERITDGFEITI